MRDVRLTAHLVRRVALRGRTMVLPALMLAVGTAITVFLALASASALHVVARQHDRQVATTVRMDPSQSSGTASDLRIVDPRVTNTRRWAGYDVRREFYAAGSDTAPIPPGVSRVPAPGEYVASPDLIALLRTNPTVASLFGSQRLVGQIGSDGLVQPHELRAVVGVDSTSALLTKVDGFGGAAAANVSESDSNPVLDASVGAYVLALIWLPAAFFIVMVAKLAAHRRRGRAVALHLIGYPKWRIQVLHFAEAIVVCLPASLLAYLAFDLVVHSATSLPGTSFSFYPADAHLPTGLGIALTTLVLLVVCAVVSSDVKPRKRHERRGERRAILRWFRPAVACLAAGLALLALPTVVPLDGALTPVALWSGTFLSAVGIATAGPTLVTHLLVRRVERAPAPALVGRRMAAFRVTTALRLASLMSVIIVLLLGSQAFAAVLNGGSAQDWEDRVAAQGQVPVVATDLSGRLTLPEVAEASRAGAAAELRTVKTDAASVTAVFATCRSLLALTGRGDRGDRGQCADTSGPVWLGRAPHGADAGSLGTLTLPGQPPLDLGDTAHVLRVPGLPEAFTGAVLVPPGRTAGGSGGGATYFLVIASPVLARSIAAIASLDPTVQLDLGALDRHNPDTQTYPSQVEWLGVGAVVSLVLAFLSLLVVSLGEAEERSRQMRALRVLGASRRDLFTSHLWCVAAPLVMVGLAAVVVGWLAARAMRNIDERAYLDPSLYGVVALAVPAAAAVISLATWRAAVRPSEQAGSVIA